MDLYSNVKIKREIVTDQGTLMPAETEAVIVDIIEPGKEFIIDFKIPAPELVTDYRWETAVVEIQDLEVINDIH